MSRLELAVEQIVCARNYTIERLDQTPVRFQGNEFHGKAPSHVLSLFTAVMSNS